MRVCSIAVVTAALISCGGKTEPANEMMAPTANNAGVSNVAAQVAALPEPARNAVLFRAIRDAEMQCQDVARAEQIAPTRGAPTWRAQCEDGSYHLIVIKADGAAQVISRTTP